MTRSIPKPREKKVFAEVVTDGERTAFRSCETEEEWIESNIVVNLEDKR